MKKHLLFFIVLVTLNLSAHVAYAQTQQEAPLCGSDPLSNLFCSASLAEMINGAFTVSISLGAILAMLRIGYAGYLYMGSDMWSNKQHARDVFRDAVIGLLLLLAIWLILNQINPDILKLDVFNNATT